MTTFFACIFAAYMIIAGLRMFTDPSFYREILQALETPGFSFLAGVMMLFTGGLFFSLHHGFATALAGVVTVISAIIALEGLVLILAPKPLLSLASRLGMERAPRPWGAVSILLGAGLGVWALAA